MKKLYKLLGIALSVVLAAGMLVSCGIGFSKGGGSAVGIWVPEKFETKQGGVTVSFTADNFPDDYADQFGAVFDWEFEFKTDGTITMSDSSQTVTNKYRQEGNRIILLDEDGTELPTGDIKLSFEMKNGKLVYAVSEGDSFYAVVTFKKVAKSTKTPGTSPQSPSAKQKEKEKEIELQRQLEEETIERLIVQLENLIETSHLRVDGKTTLLGHTTKMRTDVAKLPTYRQKMDLVREGIQELRFLLAEWIEAMDVYIGRLPSDNNVIEALEELKAAYQALADAICEEMGRILSNLGEPELGDPNDSEYEPPPHGPLLPTDPDLLDPEFVVPILPDGTVIEGEPFNDPELWEKALALYLERINDPSLSAEDRALAQQYYNMLLAMSPPG
ncbi:MAG: hypothetical protein FWD58_02960 [Firmicutes bacterium]|nr:hypothetical protein [Bacillota bacterium]